MAALADGEASNCETHVETDGQRWHRLLKAYTRPQKRRVAIHLWGPPPEMKRLVMRHRLNNRRLEQTVTKYVKGVLERGILEEMRGMIVLVEVADAPNEYLALGGGTLIESCYVAREMEPNNVNVQRNLTDGLNNCMVLSGDISDDDMLWIKRVHNTLHDGQGETLAEMYRGVEDADFAWTSHRLAKDISTTSCPKSGPFRYEK